MLLSPSLSWPFTLAKTMDLEDFMGMQKNLREKVSQNYHGSRHQGKGTRECIVIST